GAKVDSSGVRRLAAAAWLVVSALCAAGAGAGEAVASCAPWKVVFRDQGGSLESDAVVLPMSGGTVLVSVVLHKADFGTAALRLASAPADGKFAGFDPVSRLCFFRV